LSKKNAYVPAKSKKMQISSESKECTEKFFPVIAASSVHPCHESYASKGAGGNLLEVLANMCETPVIKLLYL